MEESVDLKDSSEVISVREAMVGNCERRQIVCRRTILKIFDEEFLRVQVGEVGFVVDYLDHKSRNVVAVRDRNDATFTLMPSLIISIKRVQVCILTSSLQLPYLERGIFISRSTYTSSTFAEPPQTWSRSDFVMRLVMRSSSHWIPDDVRQLI